MTYIKVIWRHEPNKYPVVLYSELSDDQYEVRKVEKFLDGTLTYACSDISSGMTVLGELAVPSLQEISFYPQFEPSFIAKEEFENIWEEAHQSRSTVATE